MDFYLRLKWYDQRLSHNITDFIQTNDEEIAKKIWWPDLYIANAKQASFFNVTVPNFFIKVYSDGRISTSTRYCVGYLFVHCKPL